jgi:hypothetical protein
MIITLRTTMILSDDEGNIIKENEYGRAYLADIDFQRAAEDGLRTKYYNAENKKKKKYSEETRELYKIVDTLISALKRTMMDRFLCRSGEVWEEYKKTSEQVQKAQVEEE